MSKIKNLLSKLVPSPKAIARAGKFAVAMLCALALGAVVGTSLKKSYDYYTKVYELTLIAQIGPMLAPIGGAVVTQIDHNVDGSICYTKRENNQRVCLKIDSYATNELNLE